MHCSCFRGICARRKEIGHVLLNMVVWTTVRVPVNVRGDARSPVRSDREVLSHLVLAGTRLGHVKRARDRFAAWLMDERHMRAIVKELGII